MTRKINKEEVLKNMFSKDGMDFENEKGWNTLAEHVDVHHRNLENELNVNVSWNEALFSWYENVYLPLKLALSKRNTGWIFPGVKKGDIYLAVSDHWYYLKQNFENADAESAVTDYFNKNRKPISDMFGHIFNKAKASEVFGIKRRSAA